MKKQLKVAQRKTYFIIDCTGTKWIVKPKSGKKLMSQLKNSNMLWLQVWILLRFFGIFIWGFSGQRRIRFEYIGFWQYIIISCHFEWTWYVKIILLPKYWCRTNLDFKWHKSRKGPVLGCHTQGSVKVPTDPCEAWASFSACWGRFAWPNPQALRTVSVAKELIWAVLMYTTMPLQI